MLGQNFGSLGRFVEALLKRPDNEANQGADDTPVGDDNSTNPSSLSPTSMSALVTTILISVSHNRLQLQVCYPQQGEAAQLNVRVGPPGDRLTVLTPATVFSPADFEAPPSFVVPVSSTSAIAGLPSAGFGGVHLTGLPSKSGDFIRFSGFKFGSGIQLFGLGSGGQLQPGFCTCSVREVGTEGDDAVCTTGDDFSNNMKLVVCTRIVASESYSKQLVAFRRSPDDYPDQSAPFTVYYGPPRISRIVSPQRPVAASPDETTVFVIQGESFAAVSGFRVEFWAVPWQYSGNVSAEAQSSASRANQPLFRSHGGWTGTLRNPASPDHNGSWACGTRLLAQCSRAAGTLKLVASGGLDQSQQMECTVRGVLIGTMFARVMTGDRIVDTKYGVDAMARYEPALSAETEAHQAAVSSGATQLSDLYPVGGTSLVPLDPSLGDEADNHLRVRSCLRTNVATHVIFQHPFITSAKRQLAPAGGEQVRICGSWFVSDTRIWLEFYNADEQSTSFASRTSLECVRKLSLTETGCVTCITPPLPRAHRLVAVYPVSGEVQGLVRTDFEYRRPVVERIDLQFTDTLFSVSGRHFGLDPAVLVSNRYIVHCEAATDSLISGCVLPPGVGAASVVVLHADLASSVAGLAALPPRNSATGDRGFLQVSASTLSPDIMAEAGLQSQRLESVSGANSTANATVLEYPRACVTPLADTRRLYSNGTNLLRVEGAFFGSPEFEPTPWVFVTWRLASGQEITLNGSIADGAWSDSLLSVRIDIPAMVSSGPVWLYVVVGGMSAITCEQAPINDARMLRARGLVPVAVVSRQLVSNGTASIEAPDATEQLQLVCQRGFSPVSALFPYLSDSEFGTIESSLLRQGIQLMDVPAICVPCLTGLSCPGHPEFPALVGAGYFRRVANGGVFLERCTIERACLEETPANATAVSRTSANCDSDAGYDGPRCGSCVVGFFVDNNGRCKACPQVSHILIVLICLAVVACVAGLVVIHKKDINLAGLAIAFDFVQVLAMLGSFDFDWPAGVKAVFNSLKPSLLAFDFFNAKCAVQVSSDLAGFFMMIGAPFAVAFVLLLAYIAIAFMYRSSECLQNRRQQTLQRKRTMSERRGDWQRLRKSSMRDVTRSGRASPTSMPERRRRTSSVGLDGSFIESVDDTLLAIRALCVGTMVSLMYYMYFVLANETVRVLLANECQGDPDEDTAGAASQCIRESDKAEAMPFAVTSLVFYLFGIPFCFGFILWRNKKLMQMDREEYSLVSSHDLSLLSVMHRGKKSTLQQGQTVEAQLLHTRRAYGRLYIEFKPRYFWWRMVLICRKFSISFIIYTPVFQLSPEFQASLCIGVFFASYVAQQRFKPFLSARKVLQKAQDAAAAMREAGGKLGNVDISRVYVVGYNRLESVLLTASVSILIAGIAFKTTTLDSTAWQMVCLSIVVIFVMMASVGIMIWALGAEAYRAFHIARVQRRVKQAQRELADQRVTKKSFWTSARENPLVAAGSAEGSEDGNSLPMQLMQRLKRANSKTEGRVSKPRWVDMSRRSVCSTDMTSFASVADAPQAKAAPTSATSVTADTAAVTHSNPMRTATLASRLHAPSPPEGKALPGGVAKPAVTRRSTTAMIPVGSTTPLTNPMHLPSPSEASSSSSEALQVLNPNITANPLYRARIQGAGGGRKTRGSMMPLGRSSPQTRLGKTSPRAKLKAAMPLAASVTSTATAASKAPATNVTGAVTAAPAVAPVTEPRTPSTSAGPSTPRNQEPKAGPKRISASAAAIAQPSFNPTSPATDSFASMESASGGSDTLTAVQAEPPWSAATVLQAPISITPVVSSTRARARTASTRSEKVSSGSFSSAWDSDEWSDA